MPSHATATLRFGCIVVIMHLILLGMLLLVPVGGAFGEAAAEGRPAGEGSILVDIEVEAEGARTVVAHVIDPGDEQKTLSMNPRDGGVFAASAELEQADHVVVFEVLDGPEVIVSRPLTLSELGVDPGVLGAVVQPRLLASDPEQPEESGVLTPEVRRNLWVAVALAASALALLAFWAAGPKESRAVDREPAGADEGGASGDPTG